MDRILSNGGSKRFAVLKSSINDCLLNGRCHRSVLDRIQDVTKSQSGVKWVMLAAGFEDILRSTVGSGPHFEAMSKSSAADIIGAHKVVIDAAHGVGLKICGVTYPPFGANYTEKGETMRVAVNNWIRQSGAFDAVVDFDGAIRDATHSNRRRSESAGFNPFSPSEVEAEANSIDLSIFD